MKGLWSARMVTEDGPGKKMSTFCSFWRKKALYWKRNDPTRPAVMWHLCFSSFPPYNFQGPWIRFPSLICVAVAVACKVVNHRHCAPVDPHANEQSAIFFLTHADACVRILAGPGISLQPEPFSSKFQISWTEKKFHTLFVIFSHLC